ncbi:MAG: FG-GAP-like repeat-containing protein [Gammaproteobacteria bacterium]|nr:FG-GAP-like repeat-containing protein [Gammaproteobacteria bacterium]
MSMFEISRAQGTKASEAVEPGTSVVITQGELIICDQSFTEVSSVTRIDNNLQLIVADNPPTVFNQFFSAPNSLIQFTDQQFTNDDLNKVLSVHLTSTDSNQTSHEIFLSPGSAVFAQPGENYYLNSTEFNIKDLHRHGKDLLIQSHDETAKTIAILKDFFKTPESGFDSPELNIIDPTEGSTHDMVVNPHSSIFQWEGEPLPVAVVGSLYGYYFKLEGAQTEEYHLVARTENGALPSWMTFSHLGGGQYYLSGTPPSTALGNQEIFIEAYCIKNKIGFHTQQSYELTIKASSETTTRAIVDDVAAAEYRSLGETITADSFVTGVVAVNQMPYMSMPEIAVLTSLPAVNPMTMAQTFSSYTTHNEIQPVKGLHDQSIIIENQKTHTEDIANHIEITAHPEGGIPNGVHGLSPVKIVHDVTTTSTTKNDTTTETSSSAEPTTPTTNTSTSTGTDTTTETTTSPPSNPSATNHSLLTILTTPPPTTFTTLQSYLDGVHGVTFGGDIFFNYYPGTLGTSAFIIPNATGNGYGVLVDASTSGRTSGNSLGDVYYLNGQSTFPTSFHISDPGVTGTVFYPPFGQVLFPTQIYNASDFNGDGSTDMFFVAYSSGGFTSYIVFGSPSGFPSTVNLGNLVSSGGAVALTSSQSFTNGGVLGDINGDGLSDLGLVKTISFPGFTQAYVFLGTHTPPNSLDVSALDGTNGFTITAAGRFGIGQSNTIMGIDLNGDGFNDILFKSYHNFTTDTATIIFGNSTGFPSTFDIGNVGQVGQPAGFVIYNSTDSPYSSHHFADPAVNIGNFNGSGIDSLVISELDLFTSNSSTYVIFGSHSFTNNVNFDLNTLNGSNGFLLTSSAPQHYVTSIAYLGDVNGDGKADFGFIDKSAYSLQGAAYIIFGSSNPFPAVIDYSHLTPNQGFVIQFTPGVSATTIGGGGDLNGDGIADIVLSNPTTNVGPAPGYGASGVSYIVFGGNFNGVITLKGTSGAETLTGTNGNDVIYGGGGNDTINALGGNDFINALGNSRIDAGQGNDTIVYYRDDAPVSGGTGTDTLWFKYDNTHVTFIGATNYTGIDAINLTSMQSMVGNSVTLDAATVLSMSDANLMTITGNAHDTLTLVSRDIWTSSSVISGYTTYTSMSGSVLNVQNDVHVNFSGPVFVNLGQPFNGFEFDGQTFAISGREATMVADMTGDGLGDLIVGVYIGASYYGEVHLIPGSTTPFPNQFDITNGSVNGTIFTATSPNANLYPYHVAGVTDFNGDGLDDILIVGNDSSRYYSFNQTFPFQNAKSYIVFGDSNGFAANVDISTLVSNGGAIEFSVVNPSSGIVTYSFTNGTYLGDINGDGLADIIISDFVSSGVFTRDLDVFVVFGTSTPSNHINLSTLDGTNGFELTPTVNQPSFLGMTGVDINGDGFNDVFLNTYRTTPYNNQVTVTFGRSTGFSPSFDPTVLPVGEGFIIHDSTRNDSNYNGLGVRNSANIGDFNQDGIDDVMIIEKGTQGVYIIFGDPSFSTTSTFDLASINGLNGIKLSAGPDGYIVQVAYLGDVNGDGLSDIGIVNNYSYGGKGAAYIVFGSTDVFASGIDLTNLTKDQGFTILGADSNNSLYSISGGADVNGDGLSDIVVSGPYINNSNGASYVIFGSNFNNVITLKGTSAGETLTGTAGDDVIYGAGGNDTINALGGNDFISALGNSRIYAGQGNDTIVYYRDDAQVQGGTGTDMLWFKYDNTHVTFIDSTNYTGIDEINLQPMRSLVGNSVTLDAATVLSMSDANLMTITGNAHDILTLIATDIWTATTSLAGYTTYTSLSGSVVNVENDVHVTFAPPASPVTLNFTVQELTDGTHGFTLTHTTLLNATSSTIIQNGDGFGDLFIANGFSAGSSPFTRAFIVDGQATFGASVPFDDPSLTTSLFNNTSFGFPISAYGQHVNSVGDFNGDGLHDILISEFFGGYSHIILGQPGGFAATSLIASVGINLPGHYNATTSAALGDVNGDGLSDIALSDSQSGWGAVIFGTTTPGGSITTTALTGADGFQIARPGSNISAGLQDFGTNDINGDGKNDIFVSYYDTSVHTGGIGVILGSTPAFSSTVTVSSAGISGANGFLITNSAGIPGSNNYLINPTEIGNLTGNGVDAIALSSKDTVYVIFGSTSFPMGGNFDVTSINGTNGFELNTASHAANITSIAYLGDVNGDALSDFGFLDSNAYSGLGAVYVVFGSPDPFSAIPIDFTTLNSDQGFVITDPLGFTSNQTVAGILSAPTVSGGGDLNGDGLGEIVITSGSNQHIIYGQNFNGAITQLVDPNHSSIQGVGSDDVIYGTSGNDTITGGSGDSFISAGAGIDVINGGTGNNTIVYDGFDASVDGGLGGQNTLWLENDGIMADLQGTTIFKDFDVIDLRPLQSLQGNEVVLDPLGVSNMSHTNTLQVDGGAHDALVLHDVGPDMWSVIATNVNIGGSVYTAYSSAVSHSTVYAENTLNHVSIV